MDLIYMNRAKEDVGVLHAYELDMAFGDDENNFECKLSSNDHCCQAGYGLYVENTEYGGIIDSITSDTANQEVVYFGRTWHGILGSKIIMPLQSGDASTSAVTVKASTSDGTSLVGKYLVISGDAHACIQFILDRVGLDALFTTPHELAGVDIGAYQFDRFTDAYTGLKKMLADAGLKMRLSYADGMVTITAVEKFNYTEDGEFDSSMMDVKVKKNYMSVNHLICLGTGELDERMVVHLYADRSGNISRSQTQFGLDEYAAVYDYSSVESEEELVKGGKERLRELWRQDEISVDFDEVASMYDVGDIVGAVDGITGITASAPIVKKIVTIKDGKLTIDLITGDGTGTDGEFRGTFKMTINKEGNLICTYSGTISPPIRIDAEGNLVYTYSLEPPALHIDENGDLILTQ